MREIMNTVCMIIFLVLGILGFISSLVAIVTGTFLEAIVLMFVGAMCIVLSTMFSVRL